jgi:hypothetical protein
MGGARARKIPSIIRLGQRISKPDMPAGALLSLGSCERILSLVSLLCSARRDAAAPMGSSPASLSPRHRTKPSKHLRVNTILYYAGSLTEQARQRRRSRKARDRPAGGRPAIRDHPRRPPAIARPRVASSGVASRPAAAWARVSQKVFSPV